MFFEGHFWPKFGGGGQKNILATVGEGGAGGFPNQHMVHVWSWVVSINVDVDGGDGRHRPRAKLAASASLGRV